MESNALKAGRFPRVIVIIILAEFCERFSYSGMRAFLTLYLRSKLGYSDDAATETFHVFSTFVYIFPIIGGILADNYLGKFRTIFYLLFVYAAGNILVALAAIPSIALPARLCTLLGLFMITVGAGGIKPCVTAFGGDQFRLPEQEKYLAVYFSIMYFNLCTGSLIAKTVSPILRSDVHCFGEKDCYSLAFGAPAIVVLVSIVIFVSAKSKYIIKKPEGNILIDFVKCVSLGIKNVMLRRGKNEKHSHWLDTTDHVYDKRFVRDIKKTLSLLMLFTVLPAFWALLDQMGSRWTLQATKMDGRFGFVTIKPDQMQVLSPIFILIMIPLAQKCVYPYLERRNILKNPLHKLTLGGTLAGLSFIASGLLEMHLKTTYPVLPEPGYCQLRIFNGNNCTVTLESNDISYTMPSLSHTLPSLSHSLHTLPARGHNITLQLSGSCIQPSLHTFHLEDATAVSYYTADDHILKFQEDLHKSRSGFPLVRFLVPNLNASNLTLYNKRRGEVEMDIFTGVSGQAEVFASTYSLLVDEHVVFDDLELLTGGVYSVILGQTPTGYKSHVVTLTQPNSVSMAFLLPQFLIMSIGEVLFAVTGNELAFKEAPESMKAVMTSVWLLTEAVGNVIIIVITRLFSNYKQETQFFIYTGIMFTSIALFHHLSKGYKFEESDDENGRKRDCRSNSEIRYMQVKQVEDTLDH